MANELNLKAIVKVDVNLALKAAVRKSFNLGLIIGTSAIISVAQRVKIYASAADLLSDGFLSTSDEYKAAVLYFSQHPEPDKLAVGIKASGESWVEAFTACRAANSEWYMFVPLGISDDEAVTLAASVEAADPDTMMLYTTHTDDVLQETYDESTPPVRVQDVFMRMKALLYRKSWGVYCDDSTESAAAWMGVACGLNSGTNNSAFTMAYKSAVGVATDALSEAQVQYVAGSRSSVGNNGNVYVTRAEEYNLLQQGYMADGSSLDEVLNLDMLKNDIRLNVMDLLARNRKIPQTEGGMTLIENVINAACDKHVNTGFIAPGVWKGLRCLDLEYGDYLPSGYLVQHEPIDTQAQADRERRIAPPFYVCVKQAGAVEFVIIEVNVNR